MKRVSLSNLLLIVCFGFLLNASVGKLKHQEECGVSDTLDWTFDNCNFGCFPYDGRCLPCSGCCNSLLVCLHEEWCENYLKYIQKYPMENERGLDIPCSNNTSENAWTDEPLDTPKTGSPTDSDGSNKLWIILPIVVLTTIGFITLYFVSKKCYSLRTGYQPCGSQFASRSGIAMNTMGAQNQSNGPAVTSSQNGHATRLQASNGTAGIAMNTMGAQNQSNGPAATASQNGHATRLQASNGTAGIAMNTMGAQNQSNGPAVTASQNGHATRLQASNRTAGVHRPSGSSMQTTAQRDPEQVVSRLNQGSMNSAVGTSISDNNLVDKSDEGNPLLFSSNGMSTSAEPHTGNWSQGNSSRSTGSHSNNVSSASTDAGPAESVHYNRMQNGNLIGNRSESQPPSELHTSNNDIRDAGVRLEFDNYGTQLKEEEDPPSLELYISQRNYSS